MKFYKIMLFDDTTTGEIQFFSDEELNFNDLFEKIKGCRIKKLEEKEILEQIKYYLRFDNDIKITLSKKAIIALFD